MKKTLKTIAAVIAAVTVTMCLTHFSVADAETVSSFESLYTAVQETGTSVANITLGEDIIVTDPVTPVKPFTVNSNKNIIIDLNGKTITFPNQSVISVDNATLTLKNGKIVSETENNAFISVTNRANLYMENVQVESSAYIFSISEDSKVYASGVSLVYEGEYAADKSESNYSSVIYDYSGNEIDLSSETIKSPYFILSENTLLKSENNTEITDKTYNTTVKAEVVGTYSISVPTEVDFGKVTYTNDENDRYVTVVAEIKVGYMVVNGENLIVTVKGGSDNGNFEITDADSHKLNFDVLDSNGNSVQSGGTIATFKNAGTQKISFRLDKSTLRYAGEYSGSVVFEVAVE